MPEFLREIFGLYAPIAIPLIRIGGIILAVLIILKVLDSGLKRLRLLIPADSIGVARVEQRAETLRHIIRSVAKGVLGVILLLTISSELGFDIGPILASAGILGLAAGFGAQSLVKDVISGFFILLEDQFGIGDVIRVGEHSGTVEQMSLRATVLRNLEGQVHVIPNGSIQTVTVLTKEWARAVVDVTVAYKESLDEVFKALGRVGERLYKDWPDRILERPAILGVEDLSTDGVKIRLIAKTSPLKQWDVMRDWRKRIKEEFDRSGMEMPQRGVLSEKGTRT